MQKTKTIDLAEARKAYRRMPRTTLTIWMTVSVTTQLTCEVRNGHL